MSAYPNTTPNRCERVWSLSSPRANAAFKMPARRIRAAPAPRTKRVFRITHILSIATTVYRALRERVFVSALLGAFGYHVDLERGLGRAHACLREAELGPHDVRALYQR